jgi:hypothetical protein
MYTRKGSVVSVRIQSIRYTNLNFFFNNNFHSTLLDTFGDISLSCVDFMRFGPKTALESMNIIKRKQSRAQQR